MPTPLEYRRLRAPKEHGQTLQDPTLGSANQAMHANLQTDRSQVSIGNQSLTNLANLARKEVFDLAYEHSSRYFNVANILEGRDWSQIVMSGHQPKLFHPGVWFKNFALSSLGQRLGCGAINLVVDNDICGVASIKIPSWSGNRAAFELLPIDTSGDNIPFEERSIIDTAVFDSFADRVTKAMSKHVVHPIVESLWRSTKELRLSNNNLGNVLAATRHQFELESGAQTLEVPLSLVAGTTAFAQFTQFLLDRAEEFQSVYNDTLLEYRRVHKIRSRSHPVPPLGIDGEWFEVPLWIWNKANQIRGRLFTKVDANSVWLTNRGDIEIKLERENFTDQFVELSSQGIAVRPRALMTTMFSRTVLSDLFLHGIGGAKYDQLTDQIIQKFLGLQPPQFITLTATMKLFEKDTVGESDLMRIKNQLRDLKYHGETQLESESKSARKIVEQKQKWLKKEFPKGERRERHQQIATCNELLQSHLDPLRIKLEQERLDVTTRLGTSKILGSREFSFCLFPHALVSELKSLVQ